MSNDRNAKGQFLRGNLGGPGRPRLETERSYLRILRMECPPETWRDIVRKAVERAKLGDAKAREWLGTYLVGKPAAPAPTLREMAVDEAAGVDDVSEHDVTMASLGR